ncbi:MAG: cbb3-type cytochrome c oxidase subunit I [Burkholderiales bacterium]|nr:cbb3-type cytochrome c oxidase subunit I [Burkholderiales bacterium]
MQRETQSLSRLRKAAPNSLPRPDGELEALERAWAPPKGWRRLSAVNNTQVGLWYIGAALLFMLLAGLLALMMRTQLALPQNDLIGPTLYNQLFTMHGTVMMFLFAVPVVEAMAVYILPAMLGARDLPFPRLSAYALWAYLIGGLMFFGTLFFDAAPSGGWFMYPPLTSYEYSRGIGADFWLLGIGFIEISAIAGAIELIVGTLRTRAPGMSLGKMPIYAWTMLVVGAMIVFGFPPVIAATLLLEIERAFQWPFFIAARGGDPLLWQHLFWLFGHPEVYIIFLPAAGMISTMVPALARTGLVGYRWVVAALIGVGILSLGLWAHHMFATGIPQLSLNFFSAASMAVAIPTGMQIFAWIATLWRGNVQRSTPTWFLLAFFASFVFGGLTGVMLAVVPYDWQVHDTYFVVAHLHYVLIGGMVFPLFAALYYWAPLVYGRKLSERIGTWACALMFSGFTVAFLPMHLTGLLGMPRRVHTYQAGLGWDALNLVSTLGAFTLASGIALVFVDLALSSRRTRPERPNVWHAGSLEWLPQGAYGVRSIPRVEGQYPLWDNPALAPEVQSGQHYLPGTATGARETIVTSPIDASPQYLLLVAGPSWLPLLAGAGTAAFFLFLTVKLMLPAALGGVIALVACWLWLWQTDRGPVHAPVDIGGGITLPVYASGSVGHSWWAMVVLLLVSGTILSALVFAFYYYWTIAPGPWPPAPDTLPAWPWPAAAALLCAGSARLLRRARQALDRHAHRGLRAHLGIAALTSLSAWMIAIHGQWQAGSLATAHAFDASVYALLSYQGLFVAVVLIMAAYLLARSLAGVLDGIRRVSFEVCRLFWLYTLWQGVFVLAVIYGSAALAGAT